MWPMRWSMRTFSVPRSSIIVRWVWRRPWGVRPLAIGSQQASARSLAPRPRAGTPGHGSPSSGTGRASCGAFFGYQPDTAGVNSQVAKPFRRQWAACSETAPPHMNPRSVMACSTLNRLASVTRSGWLRTFDTVPVETSARRATSTSFAPWWPPVRAVPCPRKT